DEFSRIDRWVAFFRKLVGTDGACVIRFGRPLDPFGNRVDDEGRSIAPGGKIVDPGTYVMRHGKPVLDARRDAAYTRELGETILGVYKHETVLMPTQLVAHVLFRRIVRETPGVDLFGRLRFRGEIRMTRAELLEDVGATRDRLIDLETREEVHLSHALRKRAPSELLDRTIAQWDGYHTRTVARRRDADI